MWKLIDLLHTFPNLEPLTKSFCPIKVFINDKSFVGCGGQQIDDEIRVMAAGDHLDIPAHVRHRVEWTDADIPTVWLALHYR